jgi:hypothetical protein
MNILIRLVLCLLTIVAVCATPATRAAGGVTLYATITPSANPAALGQATTLSIHAYYYVCTHISTGIRAHMPSPTCPDGYTDPGVANATEWDMNVLVSGSGNTLSASSVKSDSNGNAQVTLSSSVAETKTITVTTGGGDVMGTKAVTFGSVPAATTAAKPKTTTATTQAPPKAEPAPPAEPSAEIKLGATTVKAADKPIINTRQQLTLGGKTVANGVVSVYVFSDPQKFTTTADGTGNWSYTVPALPAGDHHIEAEVTDPATGKTSARAQVLAFSVKAAGAAISPTAPRSLWATYTPAILGGLSVLLLAVIGGSIYIWRFRRKPADVGPKSSTPNELKVPSSKQPSTSAVKIQ